MLDVSWLQHPIPLWVFLLALLTTPHQWASRIADRIGPLLDKLVPGEGDDA